MKSHSVSNIIQLIARPNINLKSGDTVYINIVKKLFNNKWAVSLKGSVFTAYSDLDLTPGQKIKAFVDFSSGKLLLHIKDQESQFMLNIMNQLGVNDIFSKFIISGLLRSRIPVSQNILSKLKNYLNKNNKKYKQSARNASVILKKNIEIKGSGIDEIMSLLESDNTHDYQHSNKKRNYYQHKNKIKIALKKQIEKTSETGDNPLQIFNHLNGKDDNWLVFPYNFVIEETEYKGRIKIQYDYYNNKINKFVFTADSNKDTEWNFLCDEKSGNTDLSVFCNNSEYLKSFARKLSEIKPALKHLKVNFKENFNSNEQFDGFSPDWDDTFFKKINIFT